MNLENENAIKQIAKEIFSCHNPTISDTEISFPNLPNLKITQSGCVAKGNEIPLDRLDYILKTMPALDAYAKQFEKAITIVKNAALPYCEEDSEDWKTAFEKRMNALFQAVTSDVHLRYKGRFQPLDVTKEGQYACVSGIHWTKQSIKAIHALVELLQK